VGQDERRVEGEVRELENIIERAVVLSTGPALSLPEALVAPPSPRSAPVPAHSAGVAPAPPAARAAPPSRETSEDLAEVERAHVIAVLDGCGWRVKGPGNAAERLGLNPSTLRGRMRKLGIQRPI
jgi:transcriptional regulator with GAF, ATPase, and Fis domain